MLVLKPCVPTSIFPHLRQAPQPQLPTCHHLLVLRDPLPALPTSVLYAPGISTITASLSWNGQGCLKAQTSPPSLSPAAGKGVGAINSLPMCLSVPPWARGRQEPFLVLFCNPNAQRIRAGMVRPLVFVVRLPVGAVPSLRSHSATQWQAGCTEAARRGPFRPTPCW